MRFLLLVGISFLSYSHHSEAEESPCVVRTLPNGVQEITLPDKTLYAFFTPHLSSQINQLQVILSGRSVASKEAKEALSNDLKGFLNDHLKTSEREMQNVSVIINLLKSYPDIQWFGIEASRKELESINWVKNQLTSYRALKEFLLAREVLSLEETKNLLHLVFGEEIITLVEYPELFRFKKFFIPLDDDYYKAKSLAELEYRRHIWNDLVPFRLQELDIFWRKQIRDCENEECKKPIREEKEQTILSLELVPADDTTATVPQEQIRVILRGIEDGELRDLVEAYFIHHTSVYRVSQSAKSQSSFRDFTAVRQWFNYNGQQSRTIGDRKSA